MFRLSRFYLKEFIIWKENCLTRSGNQVDERKLKFNFTEKKNSNQAKNVFGQLQFFFEIVSEMKILKIRGFLGPTQNVQKTF